MSKKRKIITIEESEPEEYEQENSEFEECEVDDNVEKTQTAKSKAEDSQPDILFSLCTTS